MTVSSIIWENESRDENRLVREAEVQTLRELGISQLLLKRKELSEEALLGFFRCGGEDILLRQGVLMEFMQKEEISDIFDTLLLSIGRIKQYLKEYSLKDQEKIVCCQALYLLLREYAQIVRHTIERLEDAEVKSRGLGRLLNLLRELWDRQNLTSLQESLSRIEQYWNPPKVCEFGLNIDLSFHVMEITVTQLFSQRESAESNCFSRPTRLHRGASTAKLQYYYFNKMKSLLNTELSRLQRDLKPFSPEMVLALLRLEQEFTLFSMGAGWCQRLRRKNFAYCFPSVSQRGMLYQDMVLPEAMEIPEAADSYTVNLEKKETVCIVTGASNAYKDGFMVGLGANQVLFQLGFPVCAKKAALPVQEHIFTIFAQGESEDESRFGREARLTAQIEKCGGDNLILLRDAYTSTNAQEGEKIAAEFIKTVTRAGCLVFCSTHFAELVSAMAAQNISCASYVAASGVRADGSRKNALLRGEPDALSYARELARKHGFTMGAILEILSSKGIRANAGIQLLKEFSLAQEGGDL